MFELNERQKAYIKGGTFGVAARGEDIGWAVWHNEWLLKGLFQRDSLKEFAKVVDEIGGQRVLYRAPKLDVDTAALCNLTNLVSYVHRPCVPYKMSVIYDTFMPPPPAQFGAPTAAGRIKEHCDITGIGCADEITAVAVALVVTDKRLSK